MLCAAEGGLKGAHAEEWVSLGALSAISMALEVGQAGMHQQCRGSIDRLIAGLTTVLPYDKTVVLLSVLAGLATNNVLS